MKEHSNADFFCSIWFRKKIITNTKNCQSRQGKERGYNPKYLFINTTLKTWRKLIQKKKSRNREQKIFKKLLNRNAGVIENAPSPLRTIDRKQGDKTLADNGVHWKHQGKGICSNRVYCVWIPISQQMVKLLLYFLFNYTTIYLSTLKWLSQNINFLMLRGTVLQLELSLSIQLA